MDKLEYLQKLKLFGYTFYNDDFSIDKNYEVKNIKNCKICNLYKIKETFYENKCKKAKIFILSQKNFYINEAKNFDEILAKCLNINLKNTYFSSVVKCANNYDLDSFNKCYQYSLNEILESEAEIIILLGQNLKNIFNMGDFEVGDKIFYNFYGKKVKVLLNYDFDFIKKNPSFINAFEHNLKKLKEEI